MNIAGTNAIAASLVSQIQNTRILFGESPQYLSRPPVPPASFVAAASSVHAPSYVPAASPVPVSEPASPRGPASAVQPASSPASSQPPTHAQLQKQLADAQLSNAQTLFGGPQSASPPPLPPIAGQTPQQIETVAIQSSLITQQFDNISRLFSSAGIGTKLNTFA